MGGRLFLYFLCVQLPLVFVFRGGSVGFEVDLDL